MIEAVLFDLYETLITETRLQPTRASSLGPALGLDPQAYRAAWKARRPRIMVGEMSFEEALTDISRTLAGRVDAAAVQRLSEQRAREKADAFARLDDAVTALVAELGQRGLKLGVVSNGFREDVLPWSGCALAPAFHCRAFSCDEGVAKPDPEIYLRAVRRLGVQPAAAVYIGDGDADELAGAEKAGLRALRACWFVRNPAGSAWPEVTSGADALNMLAAG